MFENVYHQVIDEFHRRTAAPAQNGAFREGTTRTQVKQYSAARAAAVPPAPPSPKPPCGKQCFGRACFRNDCPLGE